MHTLHRGIILKTYAPLKQKFALLDERHGKIIVVPTHRSDTSPGSMITYNASMHYNNSLIHNINVHDVPLFIAHQDIAFLHCVLELCYYFIPQAHPAPEVFMLIERLYSDQSWVENRIVKKLFLITLCAIIGVYPIQKYYTSHIAQTVSLIRQTACSPVEYMHLDEKGIDEWLHSCVYSHPIAHRFKAINFLPYMEQHEI